MYNNCVREQVSITTRDVVIVVTSGLVIIKVRYLIKLDLLVRISIEYVNDKNYPPVPMYRGLPHK